LKLARLLTVLSERSTLARKEGSPLLSNARFKFLGLNLDFSIDKARRELGYKPRVTFKAGMQQTIDWFRNEGSCKSFNRDPQGSARRRLRE